MNNQEFIDRCKNIYRVADRFFELTKKSWISYKNIIIFQLYEQDYEDILICWRDFGDKKGEEIRIPNIDIVNRKGVDSISVIGNYENLIENDSDLLSYIKSRTFPRYSG